MLFAEIRLYQSVEKIPVLLQLEFENGSPLLEVVRLAIVDVDGSLDHDESAKFRAIILQIYISLAVLLQ